MTSRPAALDPGTPIRDSFLDVTSPIGYRGPALFDKFGELERQLALAQTEIKGHMRVEDELKAAFDGLLEAAKVRTAVIDSQQARIAELEKDAARYRSLNTTKHQSAVRTSEDKMSIGIAFYALVDWEPDHFNRLAERLDAAIDAALKDRA